MVLLELHDGADGHDGSSGSERLASLRKQNDGTFRLPQASSQASSASWEEAEDDEESYLQPSEQEMLFSVMDSDEVTPSLSQARRLRRMSEAQTLTDDAVLQLLSEVKGNQVEYVKVPVDKLRSYFRPDTSMKQMTETLVKAMDFYNKHLERQRQDRDAR